MEEIKEEMKQSTISMFDEDDNETLVVELEDILKILDDYKNRFSIKLNNQLCEDIEPDIEDFYMAEIEAKANRLDNIKEVLEKLIEENTSVINASVKGCTLIQNDTALLLQKILDLVKEDR